MDLAASRKYLEIINIKNDTRFKNLWNKRRGNDIFNYTGNKYNTTDNSFIVIDRIHNINDNKKIKRINHETF